MEPIVGIDLGTTNSEVSYVVNKDAEIIMLDDDGIVPSCVGLEGDEKVIVGRAALNQALVAPDKTVLSIKRQMGGDDKVKLGRESFSAQEISAFILKELKRRAEARIGRPVNRAVITVPAYFTDAQRQATREAGQIAGLEVVRIINEPTAAALAYESSNPETGNLLVYDLGGGTFDVSIVKIEQGVLEVLSSTGDNHLGGDDFDQMIAEHLVAHIKSKYQLDPETDAVVRARLLSAAEQAKKTLSFEPFATIEEDHIGQQQGRDVHLSLELARTTFEDMIEPRLEETMSAVSTALEDARLLPGDIDKVILVGGSTRIPRISQMLAEKIGQRPRSEIDPDLCVALGAGIQAGREMGIEGAAVLVDITPYTFGTSCVGTVKGMPSLSQFVPLINRNAKLPVRKSDVFYTLVDEQEAVKVQVFQGEAPDALDNVCLGKYMFNLTPAPAQSEIILNFDLDLNGILKIKAVEKKTGKMIDAVIENAISRFSNDDLERTRTRIDSFWGDTDGEDGRLEAAAEQVETKLPPEFDDVITRAQAVLAAVSAEDRDELVNLMEDIRDALGNQDPEKARELKAELDDFLFYLG